MNINATYTTYYENGNLESQEWHNANGDFHRGLSSEGKRLPAVIEYYENGNVKMEEWWIDGKNCNDSQGEGEVSPPPLSQHVKVEYKIDGSVLCKYWNYGGGRTRSIRYCGGECISIQEWRINGLLDSRTPDGDVSGDVPARVEFFSNGNKRETWCLEGKTHRVGAPAYVSSNRGRVIAEEWSEHGLPHRTELTHEGEHLPAYTHYYASGALLRQEWFIDGFKYRVGSLPSVGFLPSVVEYHENGIVRMEDWIREREEGLPTMIYYDTNGNIEKRVWKNQQEFRQENVV